MAATLGDRNLLACVSGVQYGQARPSRWFHMRCRQNHAVVPTLVFSAKRGLSIGGRPAAGWTPMLIVGSLAPTSRQPVGLSERTPVVDIKVELVDHRRGGILSEPPSDELGVQAASRGGMELLGRSCFDWVSVTRILRPFGQTRRANSTPAVTSRAGESCTLPRLFGSEPFRVCL